MIKTLINQNWYHFTTKNFNLRTPLYDKVSNKCIDTYLDGYGQIIRAFLLKRKITRDEIWPKIHIISSVPKPELHHLSYQSLCPIKQAMNPKMMAAIIQRDPDQINSAFIISLFCEEYFKPMIDEYVSKVLLCGKAPKNQAEMSIISDQAINWYRVFFFGQKLTSLQREIERAYLALKQAKFHKFNSVVRSGKVNVLKQCLWTSENQRVIEDMSNWVIRDSNDSDINNRPWFEPLDLNNRAQQRLKLEQLSNRDAYFSQNSLKSTVSSQFNFSNNLNWRIELLYIRTLHWVKSIQFSNFLNLPHDYSIQALIMQLHIWLIFDRLKEIGTPLSCSTAEGLKNMLNHQLEEEARKVHTQRTELLVMTFRDLLDVSRKTLDFHFNVSNESRQNPYWKIDALVWSVAFGEKIPRYSEQVYIFSDYLVKNYLHLRSHTQEDILDGVVEFEVFLIDPKCKDKIMAINPPMSKEDFERQYNSNAQKKDYQYSRFIEEVELNKNYKLKKKEEYSFSFAQLMEPFYKLLSKYNTMVSMDHFNNMQRMEKETKAKDESSAWRTSTDLIKNIEKEFESLEATKQARRKQNTSFPKN